MMATMVMVSGCIPVKPFSARPASVTVKPRPLRPCSISRSVDPIRSDPIPVYRPSASRDPPRYRCPPKFAHLLSKDRPVHRDTCPDLSDNRIDHIYFDPIVVTIGSHCEKREATIVSRISLNCARILQRHRYIYIESSLIDLFRNGGIWRKLNPTVHRGGELLIFHPPDS